jgi:hypothetical protein
MNIKSLIKRFKKRPGNRSRFTDYFKKNAFGNTESVSGEGSTLTQTAVIRKKIPVLVNDYDIKTFIDAPCGDFNWMRHTDLTKLEHYTGLDIVKAIVKSNNKNYKTAKINFQVKDICTDLLPAGDLLLCRDCLVHLSFADGIKAIRNVKKAKIKYLLITTFTERADNADLGEIIWRTLNMEKAPFNFPEPLLIINEECTEGDNLFTDKSLGLYRVADINV